MAQTVPARQTVQNMTEGSPVSLILRFALPIFISQVFQQLYSTADAFIVGKYLGTNAFAAVSSSGTLIMLLTSLFIGTAMGAGRAVVPMMIMLSVWCVIRIIYIMLVVHFIGEIGYIYWAYPLTWAISSTIYLIYYLRSDWVHGFER